MARINSRIYDASPHFPLHRNGPAAPKTVCGWAISRSARRQLEAQAGGTGVGAELRTAGAGGLCGALEALAQAGVGVSGRKRATVSEIALNRQRVVRPEISYGPQTRRAFAPEVEGAVVENRLGRQVRRLRAKRGL